MNAAAFDAARSADVVVFMTDIGRPPSPGRRRASPRRRTPAARALEVPAEDRALLELLPPVRTLLLVVNKVDTIRDKTLLLPLFETYSAVRGFDAIMPISAKTGTGTREVLDEIARRLPEGTTAFDADTLTNRGTGYLAAEYIREQILLRTDAEVPHAVAVTIEQFEEAEEVVRIAATIHVEKVGQRKVMVGRGGTQLGEIGAASRRRIADLLGKRVRLDLFVRVSDRWKDAPRRLAELGFEPPETTLANLIPIKRSGRRGKT